MSYADLYRLLLLCLITIGEGRGEAREGELRRESLRGGVEV